ncbi:MAG: DinB family protein [Nocardioides sp.]
MSESAKDILVRYLQTVREAVLWKLEGVSEYDARRPLTPTGTNLLGLVKHLASVELGYFVSSFGREPPVPLPWHEDHADHNDDLWVTPDETREQIISLYRLAWKESARTIEELDLDGEGTVPWWPAERNPVTLHTLLVHMIAETNRHVGQMDILREELDGAVGLRDGVSNLPDDDYDWAAYVAKVQAAADVRREG